MPDINEEDRASRGRKKEKPTEKERIMGELKAAREALGRKKEDQPEAKAPKNIAHHKVVAGDTLSGIALKYYGSAAKEKWMAIYEANKETIGNNPSLIRVGQKLNIPELPY